MEFALLELERSLKYHTRQLEDNLRDIQNKKETIQLLETANEKETQTIEQLQQAIELIKMDSELQLILPKEKQSTDIITGGNNNDNLLPSE